MTDAEPDHSEPVETVDADETEVLLADPDDYHQAQRLREIHQARQRVHDVLEDIERYTASDEHVKQQMQLADAVAAYITELEPLLYQSDWTADIPDKLPWDSLYDYANAMGHRRDENQMASYEISLAIFRQANRFLAEVKPLLEPDETDEWEI